MKLPVTQSNCWRLRNSRSNNSNADASMRSEEKN
jgi:hypothetical protein